MKNILLLGAYSDIGQAIAQEYAAQGNNVWLAGRSREKLNDLQADLTVRYESEIQSYLFDAGEPGTHAEFVKNLPALPDIVICIFGLLGDQFAAQADWKQASDIIMTNYTGAVSILNIFSDEFETRGNGSIVGISSVAGERGRQSNYLYGSAKGGFTLYLQGLRNRLFRKGVHVLTVKPGFVNTRMTEHLKLPGPLTAQPEQVAKAIVKAEKRKKNTIYVLWMWRWVMMIIKCIPEPIFKRMSL